MAAEIFCDHCGAANPATVSLCWACGNNPGSKQSSGLAQPGLTPGTTLLYGRYRILHELGAGGFGKVYKVEDTQLLNRVLAAKKLDLDAIAPRDHQEAIKNFKQEASMLAGLQHPNLPRIYEHFTDQNDQYLIMDFIEGETLAERLDKLQPPALLPVAEVVKIGIHLASVLDYLHTRQPAIIFRDLKPSNIMLTSRREVYLIDFGIARHFKPGQTGDTVKWGTREYAAPEQLSGKQTSTHSDIYSLGVVLHQLLSGEEPKPYHLAPLQLSGPGRANLTKLITRMLERNIQARPSSMASIKGELEQIVQLLQPTSAQAGRPQPTQASKAAPPPPRQASAQKQAPLKPPPKPQPTIAAQNVPHRTPALPPSPKPRIQGELCYSYTHTSQKVRALAWSPDGTRLAAAGEEPAQISLWPALTNQAASTYTVHTRPVNALAWSPDSQFLVSGGNESVARIWQPGQSSHQEYSGHKRWIQALAWSPDGQLIATGSDDTQVHLWEAVTGLQRLIYRGHRGPILALAWSPDGARIASADERGSVQVWEVASGKQLIFYKGHAKDVSALAWSPDGQQIVSGSWDGTLQLWEASSGQLRLTYDGHQRMITAVAWSPASGQIASAGKDQSVQLWQPRSGDTLYTYRGHTSNINALAWSPDGNYLASAGVGERVHVWWAK